MRRPIAAAMMQSHAPGLAALSEKEKQTLRLLLAGHDAKSIARHLDLSVHTINERLREARRKLAVSSSREAARLLRESEGESEVGADTPQYVADRPLGEAPAAPAAHPPLRPHTGRHSAAPALWAVGGLAMISSLVALLALTAPAHDGAAGAPPPAAAAPAPESETEVTRTARDWLALVDAGRWRESWAATGASFRALNTVEAWTAASQKARVPLGPVVSRRLVTEMDVPTPPAGHRLVRFRTDFANRTGATETLSLDREGDAWRVTGIYIE